MPDSPDLTPEEKKEARAAEAKRWAVVDRRVKIGVVSAVVLALGVFGIYLTQNTNSPGSASLTNLQRIQALEQWRVNEADVALCELFMSGHITKKPSGIVCPPVTTTTTAPTTTVASTTTGPTTTSPSTTAASTTAPSTTAATTTVPGGSSKIVLAFDVYYEQGINFACDGVTHLALGNIWLRSNGPTYNPDPIGMTTTQFTAWIAGEKAKCPGAQLIMQLGGSDDTGWTSFLGSDAAAAAVATKTLAFADQYGFVGADLDWETNVNDAALIRLVKALNAQRPGFFISFDDGPYGVDTARANLLSAAGLDYLNLMTYIPPNDYGGWVMTSGGALYDDGPDDGTYGIDPLVQSLVAAGFPASKINPGIGFMGSSWGGCPNGPLKPGDPFAGCWQNAGDYTMWLTDVDKFKPLMTEGYSTVGQAPYLSHAYPGVKPAGNRAAGYGFDLAGIITYENRASILAKATYVNSKGLGGLMIWTWQQGNAEAWQAISDAF